jgi:hypothetical protein
LKVVALFPATQKQGEEIKEFGLLDLKFFDSLDVT